MEARRHAPRPGIVTATRQLRGRTPPDSNHRRRQLPAQLPKPRRPHRFRHRPRPVRPAGPGLGRSADPLVRNTRGGKPARRLGRGQPLHGPRVPRTLCRERLRLRARCAGRRPRDVDAAHRSRHLPAHIAAGPSSPARVARRTSGPGLVPRPPRPRRFALYVDSVAADGWRAALAAIEHPLQPVVDVVEAGPTCAHEDGEGTWARLREVTPSGAVLVRPDGIVAWRCHELPAQPEAPLTKAFDQILTIGEHL
ncbi:hypothetical protein ACN6LL_003623 [Streptomyces violaceoruber]